MSNSIKQKLTLFGGLLVVVLSSVYAFSSSPDDDEMEEPLQEVQSALVSVVNIKPDAYHSVIESRGEVLPLWKTSLKAEVNGHITYLSDQFRNGLQLEKGNLLVKLEDSQYQTQLARATSQLATARVNLTKADRSRRQSHEIQDLTKM